MKRMTTIDLREKSVINLTDGAQLGYACDFELDICDGKILSIIIPGEKGFFGGCTPCPLRKGDCYYSTKAKSSCLRSKFARTTLMRTGSPKLYFL